MIINNQLVWCILPQRSVCSKIDICFSKVIVSILLWQDIFRKYPNKYESVIGTLCECLDTLDEPEARASIIWIIGEYAERIDNAAELLESFLDSFHDENSQVSKYIHSVMRNHTYINVEGFSHCSYSLLYDNGLLAHSQYFVCSTKQ